MTQSMKVPGRVWRQALASAAGDDRRQQLPRIRARTLVLAGKQDGFFPEAEQRSLHALLRDARLILYDDTGHFPQFERPVRFVADVVAFLREPAVPARTGT
jgi:non-heme chloroperoxidase